MDIFQFFVVGELARNHQFRDLLLENLADAFGFSRWFSAMIPHNGSRNPSSVRAALA
jgi:hypothetical protein